MFGSVPAAMRRRLARCVRSGPTCRSRWRARDRVAHARTARVENTSLAARCVGGRRRWRRAAAARSQPRSNSSGGSATTTKRHVRVLHAAELGALAAIDARRVSA